MLTAILKNENDKINPGDVIGTIAPYQDTTDNVSSPTLPKEPKTSVGIVDSQKTSAEDLSPAVRKLLKEKNLSPSDIQGTGRGGRITIEDVEKYSSSSPQTQTSGKIVPLSPMRKTIAKHLTESLLHTAPHVTTVFECDMSSVLKHKSNSESTGQKVTLTSYIIFALCAAAKQVPEINSRLHEDSLEIFSDINVGVGTATPDGGLIVPVIHKAQTLTLHEIADRLNDLTTRARDNSLTRSDVTGGTITISNYGTSGSLFATPIIINQPQSAILGIGKLEKRTKVVTQNGSDKIEILPMCYVTLTIDHRVLDGFQANTFMMSFKEILETVS